MTTFNIGSQNAASIQNVGGDMVVHDGIRGTANVQLIELRAELAHLRDEIDGLALPPESRALARGALAEAEAEAAMPAPRSNRIAHALGRVRETLSDAGIDVVRSLAGAVSLVALLA
ncbi:MAG TPA: hypothetical protein VJ741_13250 [Solirubrobacteraceae bacterium]|nr:hypothetical protein [Solirubrobacteraceae bacterium]